MNFIKKYFSKSKNKINAILTLQLSEPDIKNSEFVNFKIVDCSEVLQKNNYNPLKDSNLKILEYISEEIINSEDNILIYNAGLSITDFDSISEMLKPYELTIDKILVPNESKRNQQLAEGKEAYRNHNRWLHFYPGEIEDMHNEFELKIKNLKTKYENTETKILEI